MKAAKTSQFFSNIRHAPLFSAVDCQLVWNQFWHNINTDAYMFNIPLQDETVNEIAIIG